MIVNNASEMGKDLVFFCYSHNLKMFLKKMKGIHYIYRGENNGKSFWIFLKTDELQSALSEWSKNKENGIRAIN